MIIAIGIDSIEIARFSEWHSKPYAQLKKLFSDEEISYCLNNSRFSAHRFAVRFAVREAFFKAFCSAHLSSYKPAFLTVCKSVRVAHDDMHVPHLIINWPRFLSDGQTELQSIVTHISLTHSNKTATAFVVLEQR